MYNALLKSLCFFFCLFFLSCTPIQLAPYPFRDYKNFPSFHGDQGEFKPDFLSDQLDLVFLFDTGPGMKDFYEKGWFDDGSFLSRFEGYDWRWAYTDMSIDVQLLKTKEKESIDSRACNIWSMLFGGFMVVEVVDPFLTIFGVRHIGKCISKLFTRSVKCKKRRKKSCANGSFLPLEYQGKELELNYLTKSVENYKDIFRHTVRLKNNSGRVDYDAPVQKIHESYPIVSLLISMFRGGSLLGDAKNSISGDISFFREDSTIVYVIFTTHDMKEDISEEQFRQDINHAFDFEERVKIVLVTLEPESSNLGDFAFCQNTFSIKGKSSPYKIKKIIEKMGYPSLDICSKTLADDLFYEITPFLYPLADHY